MNLVDSGHVIACGSYQHHQIPLTDQQVVELNEIGRFDRALISIFDYVPVDVSSLLVSYSDGEQIEQVSVALGFTLFLSCKYRACC